MSGNAWHPDPMACQACATSMLQLLPQSSTLVILSAVLQKALRPLVADLAAQLKAPAGSGVKGLLLHGMGGIGKSTLAHQVAVALQDQQLYPGRRAQGCPATSAVEQQPQTPQER